MNIFDIHDGIHPNIGKEVKIVNDIIITPFFKEEYCEVWIDFCKKYPQYFINSADNGDKYPAYSMEINDVSRLIFSQYVENYMRLLNPVIENNFKNTIITGFLRLFVNRFIANENLAMVNLHNDNSGLTTVIKLNNNFEKGALVFPRQNYDNKNLPTGYGVIFPGQITHPHYVEETTKGERYTMVSWTFPAAWNGSNGISL